MTDKSWRNQIFVCFLCQGPQSNCHSSCPSRPHTMVAIPIAAGTIIRAAGADTNHGVVPSGWPLAFPLPTSTDVAYCTPIFHGCGTSGPWTTVQKFCNFDSCLSHIRIPHIAAQLRGQFSSILTHLCPPILTWSLAIHPYTMLYIYYYWDTYFKAFDSVCHAMLSWTKRHGFGLTGEFKELISWWPARNSLQ